MSTVEKEFVIAPPPTPVVAVRGSAKVFPVHRVYCVAQNYAEHAREMGSTGREKPRFFAKPADAVCAGGVLPFPSCTENLHHEVELVVALGRGGHQVTPVRAEDMVFGYAVGCDLTRRDLQAVSRETGGPWTTAKGFDRSAPLSAIVPNDECPDAGCSTISLAVNGELRQQGTTADMIWNVPEVISELSQYFELQAGDLVFTGTPAGVGPLHAGDEVTCRIDAVGSLAFSLAN